MPATAKRSSPSRRHTTERLALGERHGDQQPHNRTFSARRHGDKQPASMPNSTNTLDDLIRATGGQPSAPDAPRDVEIGPAAIDSRRIEPGEVFWAMRGPNYDGADFVDDALHNGAAGVVAGPTDRRTRGTLGRAGGRHG